MLNEIVEYYPSKRSVCERYFVDENGVKNGLYLRMQENGLVREQIFYKNDRMNGTYKYYNENGHLIQKCTFQNDKVDGMFEEYFDNGNLMKKVLYRNGELVDGPYEEYHENGALYLKGAFVDGKFVNGEKAYQDAHTQLKQSALTVVSHKKASISQQNENIHS